MPVLLAVAGQNLLARVADLSAVRLQAAQYAEHVVGIDLQLGLAKPCHVGMTGDAFLLISLPHRRNGRRLRRQLLGECKP